MTVTDEQRNVSRVLTTDSSGSFAAPNLIPGTYNVHVEFQGFKNADRKDLVLEVGPGPSRGRLRCRQASKPKRWLLPTEAAALNTTNAELGGSLSNQVINDLPLNGRNFENLLDLRPGVVKYPGNAGWTQATNGLRPHDNFFMVDGIDANDPWMAQSMMNAVMAAGDAGTMLPIDAINEFQTQQNPRAEYGWKPGAVVNVGIKSGSNAFHGTAYAYGRTSSWDANNFFSNEVGQPLPPLALEQYGASVGGPIIQGQAVLFRQFRIPAIQRRQPICPHRSFTRRQVRSLIGACQNALASGSLSALSAQLAGLSSSLHSALQLSQDCSRIAPPGVTPRRSPARNSIFSGVGRLDYRINEKNSINGMFFMSPGNGTFVDDALHEMAPQWLTTQYARSQVISGNWVYVATPTVVNSLRIGVVPLPPDLRNT